jgi:hypothetical protein
MTVVVKHTYQSATANNPAREISSTRWNEALTMTMLGPAFLGRQESSDGPAYELTQAQAVSILGGVVFNAQTGTTYTLLTSDNGKVVTLNNASPVTVTVPVGLGASFSCGLLQLGVGQVTVLPSGVTLNSYNALTKTAGRYAMASLLAPVANSFVLSGMIG